MNACNKYNISNIKNTEYGINYIHNLITGIAIDLNALMSL